MSFALNDNAYTGNYKKSCGFCLHRDSDLTTPESPCHGCRWLNVMNVSLAMVIVDEDIKSPTLHGGIL
jgi:hypothetical protein